MAQQQKQQDIQEFDYIKLFFHCLHYWYWFILCGAACVGLAALYLQHQTNVFNTSSTIMIRTDNNMSRSSLQTDMLELMGYQTSKIIDDEIQILTSHTIMEQVVRALDLRTEYRKKVGLRWVGQYPAPDVRLSFQPGALDTLQYLQLELERTESDYVIEVTYKHSTTKIHTASILEPIPTAAGLLTLTEVRMLKAGDKMRIITMPVNSRANQQLGMFSCHPAKKESNVIKLTMTCDMPLRAHDVLNKVVELYNLDAVIDKNIMATNTANFIDERLRIVEDELGEVETAVESYMKENGVTDISRELGIVLSNQTNYQRELMEIETQINLLKFLEDYLKNSDNEQTLIPSNLGVKDASLQKLINDYNALLLQQMRMVRSATESNPTFTQSVEEAKTLRQAILSSIDNIHRGLQIQKSDLAKKDRELTTRLYKTPEKERKYVEIKRQQEIKEKLYIYLYQKREENALTLASTVMPAKTIDSPLTFGPISPRRNRIWLVAIALGLGIPFLIIFLIDYLNDEVKDLREFQSVVKAPFLGHVLYMPSDKVVAVESHNNSAQAELFRTIRTNLRFMLTDKKSPIILVTSALNGEGKSYVAINVAASLALLKKKVVIVGLDIRKPTLSQYLHIDFKGELTSYLLDPTISLDDMIIPSGAVDNLDVMPSGAIPPNPGELIQSARLETLFNALKERYDYVIVDTAPLYLVSDTFHLDKYADMTIFVTRANYISREMLPYIQDIYANQKMHNMACILNASTGGKRGYGYGRYGYGRYGYGRYGYGRYGYGGYGYGYGYGYYGEKHKDA